jgi:3-deoxy-D-manno-octulosonic-acid transferase
MYRAFIFLYPLFIRFASLWNPKAARWIKGRKGLPAALEEVFRDQIKPVVWFHCASLGEFEQGRPLIEGIRNAYPGTFILLTFFSPSGLEAAKDYSGADHICYLPMDGPHSAAHFIKTVKPVLAIFIKYEFWHYYLDQLRRGQIPTLLVSAVFREEQPFFRWYGGFWKKMLDAFTCIFVQDRASLTLLKDLGQRVQLSGDTRFDRVLEIGGTLPVAAAFAEGWTVIVAGSTWDEDEKELAHFVRLHPNIRFIVAPHEISKDHIRSIQHSFPESIVYSEYTGQHARCLIIDNIGMLSRLYQYASIAYVGGGFGGDGVHNVLEAAVWGKPVVFGPIYDKYREATELIAAGGGFTAENTLDLERCFRRLLDEPATLTQAGKSAGAYVRERAGATGRILAYIQEKRLLTS